MPDESLDAATERLGREAWSDFRRRVPPQLPRLINVVVMEDMHGVMFMGERVRAGAWMTVDLTTGHAQPLRVARWRQLVARLLLRTLR